MHVALVSTFPARPDAIPGGVAGVAKYLADALVRQGVRVSVIIPRAQWIKASKQKWGELDIYDVGGDWTAEVIPGRIYFRLAMKRRVNAVLREIRPDIVHYHSFSDLSLSCEFPNVVTIHGIAERDVLFKGNLLSRWPRWLLEVLIEARSRARIQNVVMISQYAHQLLKGKMHGGRAWFISNPIDPTYFDVPRHAKRGRVFSCSRISPLKNTLGLIEAFAFVAEAMPEAELRIAGAENPKYEALCVRRVTELQLQERVKFLGYLGIPQIQRELAETHCAILPSFQENLPLTIAEAMAAGVPVVASRVGGVPEMILPGVTGILVDPHSRESIAQGMLEVLTQEEDTPEMSRQSRLRAREMFWPDVVAAQHLAMYREILGEA